MSDALQSLSSQSSAIGRKILFSIEFKDKKYVDFNNQMLYINVGQANELNLVYKWLQNCL